jgi:hypothetical protein
MVTVLYQIKIDSVDVTAYLLNGKLERNDGISIAAGRFKFSKTVTSAKTPKEGHLFEVWRGTTSATQYKEFAGYITKIERTNEEFKCIIKDKLILAVQRNVNTSYDKDIDTQAGDIGAILEDLLTTYAGLNADSTTIQSTSTLPIIVRYVCKDADVFERVKNLVGRIGWQLYYQASDDKVYIEPKGLTENSNILYYGNTTASLNNIVEKPKWTFDAETVINKIKFIGAFDIVETVESFNGDGSTTDFTLNFVPDDVKVTVGGVLKTGGKEGATETFDYQVDKLSTAPKIKFESAPAIGTGNVVITYTYKLPIPVVLENRTSIDSLGGSPEGIREKTIYYADVVDKDDAIEFAQKILDLHKDPKTFVGIRVKDSLFRSINVGDQIRVDDDISSRDEILIVHRQEMFFPHQPDKYVIGSAQRTLDDWQEEIEIKIKRLNEQQLDATDLLNHIVIESHEWQFKRHKLQSTYEKINDSLKLGHQFNSLLNYGTNLDTMEAVGNWVASDGTLSASATQAIQGTNSLKNTGYTGDFTLTDSTTSQGDLSTYTGVASGAPTKGTVGTWVYLTAQTDLTNIVLRLGSSASAYTQMTGVEYGSGDYGSETTTFYVGWNYFLFNLVNGTETGTPDWTAVDYVRFSLTKGATGGDVFFDYFTISQSIYVGNCGLGNRITGSRNLTDLNITY